MTADSGIRKPYFSAHPARKSSTAQASVKITNRRISPSTLKMPSTAFAKSHPVSVEIYGLFSGIGGHTLQDLYLLRTS